MDALRRNLLEQLLESIFALAPAQQQTAELSPYKGATRKDCTKAARIVGSQRACNLCCLCAIFGEKGFFVQPLNDLN